jgi:hypothetical protein
MTGRPFKDISKEDLLNLADQYVDECLSNTKTHVSGSGKEVQVEDRKLPTMKFWVLHWMKRRGHDIFERQYIYDIMKNEAHPLSDTFKKIREYFDAVAEDVVANEGKGIFYAKNRLGMHDRQHIENKNVEKFDFDE